MDYTPIEEKLRNPENIVLWYIVGIGNVIEVPIGIYDSITGK